MASRGGDFFFSFFEHSSGREQHARTTSSRVAVPGFVTTFALSLPPKPCCLRWTPRKAVSHSRPARPAGARSEPHPGTMGREDKSYLRPRTPSPGPRVPPGTNSGDISPSALCLPRPPAPQGCESVPQSSSPAPARSRCTPREPGGSRRGHSPDENWPWADPRRGHGERSKRATNAGSAAAAVSMATLGEVSGSFAKSCRADRSKMHGRRAGRRWRGESGKPAAARRHFLLPSVRPTTSGAPASPASPAGRGGSSPWLGGGCSCSSRVTLLGEGRGRSRG